MIICADDYGLSPAVNDGIIELLESKKISAVSCMMLGSDVELGIRQLQGLKKNFDLGLHLTLTNDQPLTKLKSESGLVDSQGCLLSFRELVKNTYKKKINYTQLTDEIIAQINRFKELTGHLPEYIDGHQHVQQLPLVRNAVVKIVNHLMKKNSKTNIYIRVAKLPFTWLMTKGILNLRKFVLGNFMIILPGISTTHLLDRQNISHNRFLLGFYDYKTKNFADIFKAYLSIKPVARDIFFCHPGYVDQRLRNRDSVIESRPESLNFLQSIQCQEIMEYSKVGLNTFDGISIY
jgi:predicted glycoside hydrolase/deacetylase ChbG (UPF0249 family)